MKIYLKNSTIEPRKDFFNGLVFTNDTPVLFETEAGQPVSHAEALKRDWDFSASFIFPDYIHSREKLAEYLVSIGLNRNSQKYRDAYAKFGENMNPAEIMQKLR